jgi:hypothetical protein
MKMMSDYIGGHQPDTFDMSNVWNFRKMTKV